jgi:acyl-CoA thioesterase I
MASHPYDASVLIDIPLALRSAALVGYADRMRLKCCPAFGQALGSKLMKRRLAWITLIAAVASFSFVRDGSAQIVALGASATAGYGLAPSESFPAQLQAMLQAKGSTKRVINAGVSGETTGEILARTNNSVPEGTRIVILSIFMLNDGRRGISPAVHQANIAAIYQQLRARHIRVIDASGLITSAAKAGLLQRDGIHLTAEGNRRVATALVASVR